MRFNQDTVTFPQLLPTERRACITVASIRKDDRDNRWEHGVKGKIGVSKSALVDDVRGCTSAREGPTGPDRRLRPTRRTERPLWCREGVYRPSGTWRRAAEDPRSSTPIVRLDRALSRSFVDSCTHPLRYSKHRSRLRCRSSIWKRVRRQIAWNYII